MHVIVAYVSSAIVVCAQIILPYHIIIRYVQTINQIVRVPVCTAHVVCKEDVRNSVTKTDVRLNCFTSYKSVVFPLYYLFGCTNHVQDVHSIIMCEIKYLHVKAANCNELDTMLICLYVNRMYHIHIIHAFSV